MKALAFPARAARVGVMTAGLLAVVSAAAAFAKPPKAEDVLAKYEKTGETTPCLSMRAVRDTDVIDDYTMLMRASGEIYLNELNGRCAGLGRERRYVHDAAHGQLCRGDIIRVLDSFGQTVGSCSLGEFEKVTEIPESE